MQSRLFVLLLKPSLFSGIATLAVTLFVIGVNNWPYFTYTTALYPLLYGDFGVVTALEQSPALTKGVQDTLENNPVVYCRIVSVAAILTGWGAFLVIRGIKNGTHTIESLENTEERKGTLQQIGERTGILVIWVLYAFISVNILFPYCLLLSRIGADVITSAQGVLMNIGAFILFTLVLHVHIIFLRLFLLRPRVFGGKAAIDDAAFYQK
jgi:hypothetical protein